MLLVRSAVHSNVSIHFDDLLKRAYRLLLLLGFVSLVVVEVLVVSTGGVAPVGTRTPIDITAGPLPSGFVGIGSSSSIFPDYS
jgi:hypothetical protein